MNTLPAAVSRRRGSWTVEHQSKTHRHLGVNSKLPLQSVRLELNTVDALAARLLTAAATCCQKDEIISQSNESQQSLFYNCPLRHKTVVNLEICVVESQSVFFFFYFILGHSARMIQIAAVTITTHQCLIACNAEITLLIVTPKSVCVELCVCVCACVNSVCRLA